MFDVSRIRLPLMLLLAGLLLGLAGDQLFYGRPVGISFAIFITLLVVTLLVLALREEAGVTVANLWLIVPLLFLAAMTTVRAAPLLVLLNTSGTLILLALLVVSLTGGRLFDLDFGGYLLRLLESLLAAILPVPLLIRALDRLRHHSAGERGVVARQVVIGVAIALPILLVFTALLASADLIFDNMVQGVLRSLRIPDFVGHIMVTLLLSWCVVGLFAVALRRGSGAASDEAGQEAAKAENPASESVSGLVQRLRRLIGVVESSVVLFSIDALFLLFVAIQFAALFGGEAFLRSQGLTYSEYARRGFFELVAVAILTLSLILVLDFITHRETRKHYRLFVIGSTVMVAASIVMLVSAFLRMNLYEIAYGFTRLRLHTHIFMVWLGLLLVYFAILLALRRTRLLASGVLIFSLGFAATLDILNPDAFIVQQNLRRYAAGEVLDVAYLGSLSSDATPGLLPLLDDYGDDIRQSAGPWLRYQLDRLDIRQQNAGWPSYQVSINRAYALLDARRTELEGFDPEQRWYTQSTSEGDSNQGD
ncbi:MAG: DUF4173 domain-containing protein [Anaerolineae bacterium]|nr:DUF4173 domain-containing protein [Anaerolineae bacterium]